MRVSRFAFRVCWVCAAGLWLANSLAQGPTVTVSNVRAGQREGTKLVDILYDLALSNSTYPTVDVSIRISSDAGQTWDVPTRFTSGSGFGRDVTPGTDKEIVWNAAVWYRRWSDQMRVEVRATVGPRGGDPSATHWESISAQWHDQPQLRSTGRLLVNHYPNGVKTVTDLYTGLMWVHDATMHGLANWADARGLCANLDYAGHTDWFLPTKEQLASIHPMRGNFAWDDGYVTFWSSTLQDGDHAMAVKIADRVDVSAHKSNLNWVWPCRVAGPPKGADPGADRWELLGDDNSRLVLNHYINGNSIIVDQSTGRMWLRDAGHLGEMGFFEAQDAVENLHYGQDKRSYMSYDDWKLPTGGWDNRWPTEEFLEFFLNASLDREYWTSRISNSATSAFCGKMDGYEGIRGVDTQLWVWPYRDVDWW